MEWTQVADIGPAARWGCAMAYDSVRQRVVLFGGSNALGSIRFNDTWEWDGAEWTQIADTGPPRRRHGMAFESSRECLVLFGGEGGSVDLFNTWEWSDMMWAKRQDMGPRIGVTPRMAYAGNHTVLFGGGEPNAAGHTWEWDGRLWTQRQNMGPPTRNFHDLAYDSDRDRVLLFGGRGEMRTAQNQSQTVPLGDTWELAIIEQ
jgi:hypothetical protein